MSKTPRTPRAKSSGVRSLGSLRISHGNLPIPTRNDPALTINQIQTNVPAQVAIQVKDFAQEKEYQDREKKLKEKISDLEKVIAQLRAELKQKSEAYHECQNLLNKSSIEYKTNIERKEQEHNHTKAELKKTKISLQESQDEHAKEKLRLEDRIQEIIDEYEAKLRNLQETKDKELSEKDSKLQILKQRMAETLGKNSMERQQQLEELKKDLTKQAQEARELQQKLKYLQQKPKQCDKCPKLEAMLEDKVLQLRLKEKAINDLQGIGRKMQIQLHQQECVLDDMEQRK